MVEITFFALAFDIHSYELSNKKSYKVKSLLYHKLPFRRREGFSN